MPYTFKPQSKKQNAPSFHITARVSDLAMKRLVALYALEFIQTAAYHIYPIILVS